MAGKGYFYGCYAPAGKGAKDGSKGQPPLVPPSAAEEEPWVHWEPWVEPTRPAANPAPRTVKWPTRRSNVGKKVFYAAASNLIPVGVYSLDAIEHALAPVGGWSALEAHPNHGWVLGTVTLDAAAKALCNGGLVKSGEPLLTWLD